jgi:hypothetical protein
MADGIIRDHGLRAYDNAALEADAMERDPECAFARVVSGMTTFYEIIDIVELFHDVHEAASGAKPRHTLRYAIEYLREVVTNA